MSRTFWSHREYKLDSILSTTGDSSCTFEDLKYNKYMARSWYTTKSLVFDLHLPRCLEVVDWVTDLWCHGACKSELQPVYLHIRFFLFPYHISPKPPPSSFPFPLLPFVPSISRPNPRQPFICQSLARTTLYWWLQTLSLSGEQRFVSRSLVA